jgi:hypothetical protein
MQFVSMDSTVVTASEAYCSLSGFTLVRTQRARWSYQFHSVALTDWQHTRHTQHEVCHTKKLVALLPRSYKKRMIPLFVHKCVLCLVLLLLLGFLTFFLGRARDTQ